jgi:pyruvate-ferredoxin/flavodoxin oxidoreductase
MSKTQTEQKRAVEAGYYPVYRFNPAAPAEARFSWDVRTPANGQFQEFLLSEGRYKLLQKANPEHAAELFKQAEEDAAKRMEFIQQVGKMM